MTEVIPPFDEFGDADALDAIVPGEPLPPIGTPLRQRPVAHGRLAFGEPLPASEWVMSPQHPFKVHHLLVWLAEGHSFARLESLCIGAEEQLAPVIDGGSVRAAACAAGMGIDSFVGHYLRCQALQSRPPILELYAAELQRMPAAIELGLPTLSVGTQLSFRHEVLQGFLFLGWELQP